ncbi:MAG: alpha/beta fold hydrolase [Verrucomicrobia bacterium]|nr:alpha/beta fold hydrolase [Verrucomicrobiota bacterium]
MNVLIASLLRVTLLLALGYLLVCLYVFFRQRTMLYHPQAVSEGQMLELARETGMSRWLDQSGKPVGWVTRDGTDGSPVVIFHGNAGSALGRQPLIEKLRAAGATGRIHVADYPGYGSAPGGPTQQSLTDTAERALDALPGRAVVVGESLGTGVAAQVAKLRPDKIQGIILVTPFESMVSAAAHHYPWLPVRLLLLDRFDSATALKTFPGPVAIILAENDATTPPEGARRLFAALAGPKKLWEVRNSDHNDAVANLSAADWREVWKLVEPQRKDSQRSLPLP